MNQATEALRRAVSGAVARGATPIVERRPKMITIKVRRHGSAECAEATFAYETWLSMAPVARVLAIHNQCRPVLQGERFEVMCERLSP